MRIRGFPFGNEVREFIDSHEILFLAEQNRDAQMKTLLVNDLELDPRQHRSGALLRWLLNFRRHHPPAGARLLHRQQPAKAR